MPFYNCLSLANVTIGSGVTNLGSTVFNFCLSLTNIRLGSNVTSNRNLCVRTLHQSVQHHDSDSVTNIGNVAFETATSCQLAIGSNVTSIGSGAFS